MSTFDNQELGDKVSIKSVAVKWGAISGAIGIVFYLILILGDLIMTKGVSYIGLIPFIVVIVMAHKEFKNQGDEFMTYAEGLKIGLMLSLIGGLILALFSFIYGQFIDPGLADRMMDYIVQEWENQGMSDEQIEQAMGFTKYMFNPYLGLIIVIIKNVLVGFILSLVISAITKKNNPELEV
ncbi:DUF4199 domain-containing protein [Fulvivirga sediminis]|uniref:DUF4199 domain-containing protein n=1 Tax=Fulvivirga sediminis TaxID=2803949 RepID=A0A937K0Z1_9BACT|nr:DUF4199 domain-containing protein [Fulvivirga sediminis]MBL3658089.1 DUF4199 domain-containing protein [Fulvivirga sediminis]